MGDEETLPLFSPFDQEVKDKLLGEVPVGPWDSEPVRTVFETTWIPLPDPVSGQETKPKSPIKNDVPVVPVNKEKLTAEKAVSTPSREEREAPNNEPSHLPSPAIISRRLNHVGNSGPPPGLHLLGNLSQDWTLPPLQIPFP